MLGFFRKLFGIFGVPKSRVRRVYLTRDVSVWGTVEKQEDHWIGECPDPVTYWTVVWDDEPRVWHTYPSHKFIWIRKSWTLLS